jgi:hypothetical protein
MAAQCKAPLASPALGPGSSCRLLTKHAAIDPCNTPSAVIKHLIHQEKFLGPDGLALAKRAKRNPPLAAFAP